ncbi:TlpA family protein disulfide reductase [Plantactinospora sp. GCM10030261]|uniref:TlpA family protein disulfide reductase n=1 Tax=Plantactinospora sp. GCM10030261 TaxID=3273420 RepID=UPI003617C23F
MSARRWYGGMLAVALAAGTVACSDDGWQNRCETTPRGVISCAPDLRPPATPLSGELLDGGRYDVADERGQVVVVNFWGSWCAPCRAEADDLESTYQATKASGVRFLGVNTQDSRDKARAFEQSFRISYPSVFDPSSKVALGFAVPPNSTPATIVLDREGRIAEVVRREVRADELRSLVEKIAAEQPVRD